jgi:alpha-ketoglutarate-dependent taurine dioxygenase
MTFHRAAIIPVQPTVGWLKHVLAILGSGHIAVVRRLELDHDEVASCARKLGIPMRPVALPRGEDLKVISRIEDEGEIKGALSWHVDQSFAARPPDWTMLYCVEPGANPVPTVFSDAHALTEYLSPTFLTFLQGLSADHEALYGPEVNTVSTHPVILNSAGGPILFVNPAATQRINELTQHESDLILARLFAMMNWPEITTAHIWEKGDLVVWPNKRYPHRALPFQSGSKRLLLRVVGHDFDSTNQSQDCTLEVADL